MLKPVEVLYPAKYTRMLGTVVNISTKYILECSEGFTYCGQTCMCVWPPLQIRLLRGVRMTDQKDLVPLERRLRGGTAHKNGQGE